MASANDILKIAAADIGYTESPANSNKTKFGKWYGLDGQAWCMMAVQYWFNKLGKPLPCKTASCSGLLNWYKANKPDRVHTTPQTGDIVIYNFGHTGIVESVAKDTITAIEGNTSSSDYGSQDNGGGVYRRTRKKSLVTAYIRPIDFEEEEMTYADFKVYIERYLNEIAEKPLPDWKNGEPAGEFNEAIKAGITDGKNPMRFVRRYEAAIMAKRAAK